MPVEPAEIALSDMFDRFAHIFADPGDPEPTEALNVNTLDETPDSSWFTNRHGAERRSIAALRRGPDTGDGPDTRSPWRVFRSKVGGLTPGFQIIDGRGDRYIIKFDPVAIPELSSAAEIIGTKLFHAIGYNTPDDVIPHEHRRELRGLRVFAAWTNHDDTRAHNTQDSRVEQGGRRFIRHYLIDFGSAFGSGSVDLQLPNLSFHYWLDLDEVKKNALSFGLRTPAYRKVEWPSFPEYAAVGRWESASYDPRGWRNDYPNPAFVRMTDRDAFWAARIIMRFTPDELRAIVETGQFSDPRHTEYFLEVLIERQRKTAREYLNRMNPLDEFEVTDGRLRFANLAERHGFAEPGSTYRVQWSIYDNGADRRQPIGAPGEQTRADLPLPQAPDVRPGSNRFLLAEIRTRHDDHPRWNRSVGVYLRPAGDAFEVVGLERESDPPSIGM